MNWTNRTKVLLKQQLTCTSCMRLWPLRKMDTENCILFVVCTTWSSAGRQNPFIRYFVFWFCIYPQQCMHRAHNIKQTLLLPLFCHSTLLRPAACVLVSAGMGDFSSMCTIHQVIRSLNNFHHWKVSLAPFGERVREFARISSYWLTTLAHFHSIHSLRLKSLYLYTLFMPSEAPLSHLFSDFAIIMSLLIGYFIVIVW